MNTRQHISPLLRSLAFGAASLACMTLGGCLMGTTNQTEISGREIGTETLDQIQPGKDVAYVTALIGEPTNKTTLDDGTEIWKWRYSETRNSSGSLIFLFSSTSKTETSKTTYVEFKGGLVVKAWRD